MKVLLSWSGTRSRAAAAALRGWLQSVIQQLRPWMSDVDIVAGGLWSASLRDELARSSFGVLCVTPGNAGAPWLLFEAGALAKSLEEARVCPYLLDLRKSEIPEGPLQQFQSVEATKEGTRHLVKSLNAALPEADRLGGDLLRDSFERAWPELESELRSLPPEEEAPVPAAAFPFELYLTLPQQLEEAGMAPDWDDDRCYLLGPDAMRENVKLVPSVVGPALRVEIPEELLQRLRADCSYKLELTDTEGRTWRVPRSYLFHTVRTIQTPASLHQMAGAGDGDDDEQ